MATWRIAVIGGDGIGPEVIEQAIRVADAAARKDAARLEWNRLPWSSAFYKKTGRMMPDDGWEQLKRHDAILLGAMPPHALRDTPEAEAHVVRTTRLFEAAGRHFNRGQRAFFFALGYLGWFVSPWVLLVTTAAVVIVTWRRQFASNAWRAMGS